MTAAQLWKRYKRYLSQIPALGLTLDVSRMGFADGDLDHLDLNMVAAFREMEALEKGAIANPDENRMVGHYWLRAPDLAPNAEIRAEIRKTIADVKAFAANIHNGKTRPPKAERYTGVLCIGIGGSALGPMFVADALRDPAGDRMRDVPARLADTRPPGDPVYSFSDLACPWRLDGAAGQRRYRAAHGTRRLRRRVLHPRDRNDLPALGTADVSQRPAC